MHYIRDQLNARRQAAVHDLIDLAWQMGFALRVEWSVEGKYSAVLTPLYYVGGRIPWTSGCSPSVRQLRKALETVWWLETHPSC